MTKNNNNKNDAQDRLNNSNNALSDLITQKKNLTQNGVSSRGRVRNSSERNLDTDAIQTTNEAIAEARQKCRQDKSILKEK